MTGWKAYEDEAYHALPQISAHLLMAYMRSGAHYLAAKAPRERDFNFGQFVHSAVLEGDLLTPRIVPELERDRRSNADKEAWAEWIACLPERAIVLTKKSSSAVSELRKRVQEAHPRAEVISFDVYDKACRMRDAVLAHPRWQAYTSDQDRLVEVPGFFQWEGVNCRMRPDMVCRSLRLIPDLKTCSSAEGPDVARQSAKFMYDVQMAFYQEGALRIEGKPYESELFFVEDHEPFGCAAWYPPPVAIQFARDEIVRALRRFKADTVLGDFAGYSEKPKEMPWPTYALRGN